MEELKKKAMELQLLLANYSKENMMKSMSDEECVVSIELNTALVNYRAL
mgnify:CR=1 FL=1